MIRTALRKLTWFKCPRAAEVGRDSSREASWDAVVVEGNSDETLLWESAMGMGRRRAARSLRFWVLGPSAELSGSGWREGKSELAVPRVPKVQRPSLRWPSACSGRAPRSCLLSEHCWTAGLQLRCSPELGSLAQAQTPHL